MLLLPTAVVDPPGPPPASTPPGTISARSSMVGDAPPPGGLLTYQQYQDAYCSTSPSATSPSSPSAFMYNTGLSRASPSPRPPAPPTSVSGSCCCCCSSSQALQLSNTDHSQVRSRALLDHWRYARPGPLPAARPCLLKVGPLAGFAILSRRLVIFVLFFL